MAWKIKRVAKNVVGTSKAVNYIAVPTAELRAHCQAINRLETRFDPYHTNFDFPKVKDSFKWIKDKEGIVEKTIELVKLRNPIEFTDEDYIKAKKKWHQNGYKEQLRQTIATSILQCKSKRRYVKIRRNLNVQQSPQPIQSPSEFRIIYK